MAKTPDLFGAPGTVVPTRDGYDRWAPIYDGEDNALVALESLHFASFLGDVRGLRVADIGCGTGRQTLALAAAGALTVGLDFSAGMLAHALTKPRPETVLFVRHDVTKRLPFADATLDAVVSCLVLEHVDDLVGVYREMHRVVRPGGFALVSNLHPAMMLRGVDARFTDPQTGEKLRPEGAAHSIANYINAALVAGFRLERMGEYTVDDTLIAVSPRADRYRHWPLLLLLRFSRP